MTLLRTSIRVTLTKSKLRGAINRLLKFVVIVATVVVAVIIIVVIVIVVIVVDTAIHLS